MYVEIKENKLLSWCENPYLNYEFVDIDYSTFDASKYEVQDSKLVDISSTDAYKAKIAEEEKQAKIVELNAQISELDLKSIRAIREGGIYDSATGQTYLEYYTAQIAYLRNQMASL